MVQRALGYFSHRRLEILLFLIPLAKDEGYTIAIESKRGLEIEFSKRRR